jgi:hypothetical protein
MPRSQARVTVFAVAGALTGVVPIPILPRRILRSIRGAMAHDVCSAHGLALTAEAREALSEPTAGGARPTFTKDALAYMAARTLARLSPYGKIVAPVRTAFDTLAFGRLLDRYLEKFRPSSSRGRVVRIDGEEAHFIRNILDHATQRAIRPGLNAQGELAGTAPEDYRNPLERAVDTAMITAARVPEWLGTRLDAALDEVMAGHRDGEAA